MKQLEAQLMMRQYEGFHQQVGYESDSLAPELVWGTNPRARIEISLSARRERGDIFRDIRKQDLRPGARGS